MLFSYLASKYRDMHLRNKIIAVNIPQIVIPLLIVTFVSNFIFTNSIIEKTKKNITDQSSLILLRVDVTKSNVETCLNIILNNINQIYDENVNVIDDPLKYIKVREKLEFVLNYNVRQFGDIESATYIDVNNNVISTDPKLIIDSKNIMDTEIIKTLDSFAQPNNIWFPVQLRSYLVNDTEKPIWTVGKKIYSTNTKQKIGYLLLNIKEDTISMIFPDSGDLNNNKNGYCIVDTNGIIISSKNKKELMQPIYDQHLREWLSHNSSSSADIKIEGASFLVTSRTIPDSNWQLVNRIPINELTNDVNIVTIIIIFIGIFFSVLSIFSALFLSGLISRPIIRLSKAAEIVKGGNFNISFESDSRDEIGLLAKLFNEMIINIKELLERIKLDQKKKREYELALIQSQIKPHFLYNTIETINMFIRLDMKANALKTAESLAAFYRISLSNGNDIISIAEEICLIENYLAIQKFRYSDYMDYSINVEDSILRYSIPKLTLQPLVENAIYHGLKHRKEKGSLLITGLIKDHTVIIEIYDNGVGMTEDKINEILDSNNSIYARRESFGVGSVNDRIKLLYGDKSGLKISSVVGEYTRVSVILEINEGGENNEIENINS